MFTWISRIFDPDGTLGALWCSLMHDSPMWPIHGHYECRECGRRYAVPWATQQPAVARGQRAVAPSLRSAS